MGLVVALAAATITGPAAGDEIDDARSDAEQVADRIEELEHDAEVLTERYLDAQLARTTLEDQIADARERAERSGAELERSRRDLRAVAVEGYVRGADNDPADPVSPGERFGYVYEINYLRCIHCDLCVEACPTEAITETKLFEFSFTNRQDAIYTKAELVVGDDGRPQQLPWEDWREGEDQHTSAWMRATSAELLIRRSSATSPRTRV